MNNEIKEILDYLGNDKNYERDCNDGSFYLELPYREAHKLKDCITNLQKENESLIKNKNKAISSLKFILDNWTWALKCHYIENIIKTLNGRIEFDDIYIYKSRNEKAIKMFDNENLNKYYYGMSYEFEIDDFKKDMLNILQGSDRDDK